MWMPLPIYFHAAGAALLVGIVIWQRGFAPAQYSQRSIHKQG